MAYIEIELLLAIERRLTTLEQIGIQLRSHMKTAQVENNLTRGAIAEMMQRLALIEAENKRQDRGFWTRLKMPPPSQIVIGGIASWVIGSGINAYIGKDGNPLEILNWGLKLLELLVK